MDLLTNLNERNGAEADIGERLLSAKSRHWSEAAQAQIIETDSLIIRAMPMKMALGNPSTLGALHKNMGIGGYSYRRWAD